VEKREAVTADMLPLKVIYTIWLRETKLALRERARIVATVAQPLIYLGILGRGITSGMRLTNAGNVDYIKFMYPGVIGMSILFTSIFAAISIIWDREFGFLKEVLVAPVPRWAVAVGKSFGGATIALSQVAILICIGPLIGISLTPLIVLQMLFLGFLMSVAVTSLGVIVASRMASMQSFQMVMNFLVMPLYFLSGAMFPMSSAPSWMKTLMSFDPLTYGVDAIRNVMFAETVIVAEGAARSLVDVARSSGLIRWTLALDVTLMFTTAVLLTAAGAWTFSKSQAM
jgi:ABC-2 type transport system permease protein